MPGPDAPPTCGRVPDAVANKTTEWGGVTCGWCLKKRPRDTAKLVQALLENEARYAMPDEVRERVIREAREAPNPHIPLQVTNLFATSWKPCAPEFSCPRCKGNMERTVGLMLASPWAGSVRCTQCDYRDSVTGYLGRSMIQVEPLPPGAVPIYDQSVRCPRCDSPTQATPLTPPNEGEAVGCTRCPWPGGNP